MKRIGLLRSGIGLTLGALVAGLGALPVVVASPAPATITPGFVRTGGFARAELPRGGRTIFPEHFLVAYYGTAGTGALGVLGEDTPDRITTRLRRAARPFAASGRTVQIVYELIVTIVDAHPGADGNYNHDIARSHVERYIKAAHRNRALLVLDLQPGRSNFLTVARRWRWALRDPWVGLALDPEWRMAPGQVPAQTIGQVRAKEINHVSGWLRQIVVERDLPQKVFMVHQFRTDMVINIDNVIRRPRLAMVQHVDGFGTRSQKLSTYHTVAQPDQFVMGLKLFYDEDSGLMSPAGVLEIRPRVRFVSYQ